MTFVELCERRDRKRMVSGGEVRLICEVSEDERQDLNMGKRGWAWTWQKVAGKLREVQYT